MFLRFHRIAALLPVVFLPLAFDAVPTRADYTATIQPGTTWGKWEGWGCSLAWWANQFGARDDMADTLFTTNATRLTTNTATYTLPGLGLNIARYNIGGTSSAGAFGNYADIPGTLSAFKQIQGYWLDWGSSDPLSSSFNWYADSNQRNMLWKARDRSANLFEAFSNSPMWWMCYNHSTAGSNGGGDNLQSWNYDAFATYLAMVVKYAHDNWGVNFDYVEPFNEPSAYWWAYPSNQEGCHFDTSTQNQVLGYLRTELDHRGLQNVAISASDENSPDQTLNTWYALAGSALADIAKINTHGYSGQSAYRGSNRGPLYNAVASAGKRLWMSEYGESDGSGLTMAQSILLDLNQMHPTGWVYWQPFDSGGWGLVQSNPGDNWIGSPNNKYYVLAQFSRHIRQGMTLISSGDPNTVTAYSPEAHTLTLVTLNGTSGQWINYDLSHFGAALGPVTRWNTQTDGGELYAQHNDTQMQGNRFWSWFTPNTLQTFVVQNVYLADEIATDVTAQVSVQRSGFRFNRASGRYVQTITLTNLANSVLTGPITLVLDNLSAGATLSNQTGLTKVTFPSGNPYITIKAEDLAAGAKANITLEFSSVNPNMGISYATRILGGPGYR